VKRMWIVVSVFLLAHAVFAAGFCGWLFASSRVDRDRLTQLVDLFGPTLEQGKEVTDRARRLAEQAKRRAISLARLQAAEQGPTSFTARIETERQVEEHAKAQLRRYREDVAALRRQLTSARQRLLDERAGFEAERDAYRQKVEEDGARQEQEDFKLAVRMYEQVKPIQAKQMFQELMDQGQASKVVDYLTAMNHRKAGAVFRQFRTEQEISQASHLLQMLCDRGIDPAGFRSSVQEPSS